MEYRKHGTIYHSKVRTQSYFIHPEGQSDAPSELEAEVEALQKEGPFSDESAQCQFPARYLILKKRFSLGAPQPCELFQKWRKNYAASHVSIIYASQYLSNPASVFGHAFFLLGSHSVEKYMQATINYAADVPAKISGPSYAFNGLTGGFLGAFSTIPFYQNRHIYSDLESREMWEYKLNLTPEELDLLVASFWELQNKAQLSYYFFDENCGAVLLWILAAVKPEADFRTSNLLYFPPSEINKILMRNHLVSEVIFHPSLTENLLAKMTKMNSDQKDVFRKAIRTNKIETPIQEALVLEALLDHLDIERHRSQGVLPPAMQKFEQEVLISRSKIPETAKFIFPPELEPQPPHLAHAWMRAQLGEGDKKGEAFQILNIRPAIHGLLDREEGFLKNSEIDLFSLEIQNSRSRSLFFEKFRVAGLANFRPVNFYEQSLSWQFHMDYLRNHFDEKNLYLEMALDLGFAKEIFSPRFTAFAMLATSIRSGAWPLGRAELGPEVGFLFSWKSFKLLSEASRLNELYDFENREWWSFHNEMRFDISSQWALFLKHDERTTVDGSRSTREFQFLGAYYF